MRTVRVVESVDIQATEAEVFAAIANCDRRFQLSPLWGTMEVRDVSAGFPQVGSSYCTRLVNGEDPEYETCVTDYVPGQKFGYRLSSSRGTTVTWTVQPLRSGTRLIYEEAFTVDDTGEQAFVDSVRSVVQNWLGNICRYLELRRSRIGRVVRWVLDRYVLRLKAEQRRVIVLILALQLLMTITGVLSILGFGLARLLF